MKNTILFFTIFISLSSQAQYNFKPADSSAQWIGHHHIQSTASIVDLSAWIKIYSDSVNYDTLIGANTYTKLNCIYNANPSDQNQNDTSYYCSFRSDTAEKAIYLVPPDSTSEYLYFDFDEPININDSLSIPMIGLSESGVFSPFQIDKYKLYTIDSVLIDGTYYTNWHLSSNYSGVVITERIISKLGLPFTHGQAYTLQIDNRTLKCYIENEIEVSGNFCPFTLEDAVTLSLEDIIFPHQNGPIDIYPNPNSGAFALSVPFQETSQISIYSMEGIKVISVSIDGKHEFDLDNIPSGIYIVELKNTQGLFTSKIVIR